MTVSENPSKSLIINFFTNGTNVPEFPTIWRHPDDHSRNYSTIEFWVEFAKIAERGKIDTIFIADHHAFFDTYKGSYATAARVGQFSPRIDPSVAISAMASVTKSLGFGVTFSTVSEHPYHFARRLASLDHLTGGRIGWNIVSSYVKSTARQLLGQEALPDHDERYVKTEEYLDAVYELLLSTWRDDAVEYDKNTGIFADPEKIRNVNFDGKYFHIEGPSINEPSPQRFPLIIQAGTSKKGIAFAAENAEVVFLDGRNLSTLASSIQKIRTTAKEQFGRDPSSIKFVVQASPILADTDEEAQNKYDEYVSYIDPEGCQVSFGGFAEIDLSKYELDEEIEFKQSNGLRTIADAIKNKAGPKLTRRKIIENNSKGNNGPYIVGSPKTVADQIEKLVADYDIDGFNFGYPIFPGGLIDIVDLLIPELQERGLFRKEYPVPGGTLRENINGVKGENFLREDHPAHDLRWTSELSKQDFEVKLAEVLKRRKTTRANGSIVNLDQ